MPVAGEEAVPTGAVVLPAAGADGAGAAGVVATMAVFMSDMIFSAEVGLAVEAALVADAICEKAIELDAVHGWTTMLTS